MELKELISDLPIESLNSVDMSQKVMGVYIGDLLSFVMANGKEGALWMTVQRHLNVIAVAELNEFSGILFVQGVTPEQDTLTKANELHIPLLTSQLDAYSLAQLLTEKGI